VAQPTLSDLLSGGLEEALRDMNPWWRGERLRDLPRFRRWLLDPVLESLDAGLTPATVVRGPRQVGKTTLLNQAITALLDGGMNPRRIFRVQFDELPQVRRLGLPILDLCRWYALTVLGKTLNQAAGDGERAFIFLDELQNLPDWAPQLKYLVDINPVRVLVTGSSALRIEVGRDSLAGRILTWELGPLLLREIAEIRGFGTLTPLLSPNGLAPLREKQFWLDLRAYGEANASIRRAAFDAFSELGGYPAVQTQADQPWEHLADLLLETVVRRAIRHDLRLGRSGAHRDERLLEAVFRLACRYAGQSPSQAFCVEEVKRAMGANVNWPRIITYLEFLDDSLLVRLIEPLELRLKRRRGGFRLCLCDHALRAAWLQEQIPIAPEKLAQLPDLADLAGHIAESVTGYFFKSMPHLDVAHFPERGAEPEVDYILTVGEQRIPVEVKYRRRIDFRDTFGMRLFLEKAHHHAPFGVLVTLTDEPATDDPRIVSLPLSSLLLMR